MTGFVHPNDVRMLDPGGDLGFCLEPGDLIGGRHRPGQDHLERDDPIEVDLSGAVDDAHAAAADFAEQHVFAVGDRLADERRAGGGGMANGGVRVGRRWGKAVELIEAPNYNHFEMCESLGHPYGPNGRAALKRMARELLGATPP